MIPATTLAAAALLLAATAAPAGDQFVPLFNGKDLSGWTAAKENPGSFSVHDGVLVVKGGRSHLFYTGDVNRGVFRNFELRLKARTTPGSNSGVYIRTRYQNDGWPAGGYEAQVNSTHSDPKKTGSLYGIVNVVVLKPGEEEPKGGENLLRDKAPSTDGQWFDYHIIAKDGHITIKVDGVTTVDYTEPAGAARDRQGTFALQAHDPKSETHYKDIQVRVLE